MFDTWKYLLLFLCCNVSVIAQDYLPFIIDEIQIEGNKRTKTHIIIHEVGNEPGDTLNYLEIDEWISEVKSQLLNTGLFNLIDINVSSWNTVTYHGSIQITLTENWFLYPALIFELADRNFNVWWKEHDHEFNRVNLGGRLDHINLTGNRDYLKVVLHSGYTQKAELDYSYPYLGKDRKWGVGVNVWFTRNREIGFETIDNKLIFGTDNHRYIYQRFRTAASVNYRPTLFSNHQFKIEFYQNRISQKVATEFNPDFFKDGRENLRYFTLTYEYRKEKLDHKIDPHKGYAYSVALRKEGIGIFSELDIVSLKAKTSLFTSLGDRWSSGFHVKAKVMAPRTKPPYFNNTALGYGEDQIRGYEYYVIDGMDYISASSQLKFNVFSTQINWGKLMPLSAFKTMPLRLNATLSVDGGYVNDLYYADNNTLSNRWLLGGGPGVQLIWSNNFKLRLEYNINHLLENGLFLHFNTSF